jgi:RimJ/RimL family protein N-acetyltransferase
MEIVDGLGTDRVLRAMGVFSLSIREALSTDSESILEWRNNPTIRTMSRNVASLDRASHKAWFDSVLSDSDRPLLIGESAGQPVGVVRFDIDNDTAELSIYMVPGNDQRGLGAELLMAAEKWLANSRPDVHVLQAEVRGGNVPSHRLFSAAGYLADTTKYIKRLQ